MSGKNGKRERKAFLDKLDDAISGKDSILIERTVMPDGDEFLFTVESETADFGTLRQLATLSVDKTTPGNFVKIIEQLLEKNRSAVATIRGAQLTLGPTQEKKGKD